MSNSVLVRKKNNILKNDWDFKMLTYLAKTFFIWPHWMQHPSGSLNLRFASYKFMQGILGIPSAGFMLIYPLGQQEHFSFHYPKIHWANKLLLHAEKLLFTTLKNDLFFNGAIENSENNRRMEIEFWALLA